jgi:hypothetical protein
VVLSTAELSAARALPAELAAFRIVMVGHSYRGAVISNAAVGNDQVKALRPLAYKGSDGSDVVDLYIDQEKFRAAFASDVDPGTAEVMAVAQRPFTEAAFGAPSGPVALILAAARAVVAG